MLETKEAKNEPQKIARKLLREVNGKTVGIGGDIDPLSGKLTAEERALARMAYDAGGIEANTESYPVWQPPLCAAINACCLLNVIYQGISVLEVVAIATVTYFYTDIISGLLHLVLDNPKFLEGPLEPFARGFQEHHLDPGVIYKMTVFNHCRVMSFPLILVYFCGAACLGPTMVPFNVYFMSISCALMYMQMAHRWAHMPSSRRGDTIQWLQDKNIALPGTVHLKHHRAPYDCNFCIMNGVFNPVLNAIVEIPVLHPHSRIWAPIFLSACFAPFGVIAAIY